MAPVLNLNNEVVKMRKEVKKIRVLTIRKLTRHLAKLKSKKGTEQDVLKNQRRAQRLLEEIHAMKELKPDDVTKTALQKEINFENACKMQGSTAEERAIARLGTHPQFKKRIDEIKAAVKAFKDERLNPSIVAASVDFISENDLEVQSINIDTESREPIVKAQAANNIKEKPIHGGEGKKNNIKGQLKLMQKEGTYVEVMPLKIEAKNTVSAPEQNMMTDSKEIMPVNPEEGLVAAPTTCNPSTPKVGMDVAPTKDHSEVPTQHTSVSLSEDMSAFLLESVPAAPNQDLTSAQKQEIPSTPKQNRPITSKDAPASPKEEGVQIKGSSLSLNETLPDKPNNRMPIALKEDSSFIQKPKDKACAKKTKETPIAHKGKTFSVKSKLDTEKALFTDSSESEVSDEEDQEYFDDSTEERFLKQSSGPDDSDSEDDFFLGKVKQTKKRKGNSTRTVEKGISQELPKVSVKTPLPMDVKDIDPRTSKPNTEGPKLESVFCHSLAHSKQKSILSKRNLKDKPRMDKKAAFQPNKPLGFRQQPVNELTTKQENKKQQFHTVKPQVKNQQLQQPLHPSWEASRKRKEQQSLITAFQGKKIKFDD